MIDAEKQIFNRVKAAVVAGSPNAFVTGESTPEPAKFPCVAVVEMDNATLLKMQTEEHRDNFASLMYQVDVFSNKKSGKKSECRAIAAAVDAEMQKLGFARVFLSPTPNMESPGIYRVTERYRGVIDRHGRIYRK